MDIPAKLSKEIRQAFQSLEQGWGRLPVKAGIGNSEWDTAIWFDTKKDQYILPLKAAIRQKEKLTTDMKIDVVIWI